MVNAMVNAMQVSIILIAITGAEKQTHHTNAPLEVKDHIHAFIVCQGQGFTLAAITYHRCKQMPFNTRSEPRREKTGFSHMRKQRRRSASR